MSAMGVHGLVRMSHDDEQGSKRLIHLFCSAFGVPRLGRDTPGRLRRFASGRVKADPVSACLQ